MANMSKREKNAEKNRLRAERERRRESLTNWYMINLSFGLLAIVIVLLIGNLYRVGTTVIYTQIMAWSLTGVFAAAAVLLIILAKCGVIKAKKRAYNYSIFMGVCALGALWLALYNKIRFYVEIALQKITGNAALTIGSHWNIRVIVIGIIVYLVIGFIYYIVKLSRIK